MGWLKSKAHWGFTNDKLPWEWRQTIVWRMLLECSCNFSNCCVNCSSFILNGSIMPEAISSAAVNNYCWAKWCFIPAEDLACLYRHHWFLLQNEQGISCVLFYCGGGQNSCFGGSLLISVCPCVPVITRTSPCLLCSSCSYHGNQQSAYAPAKLSWDLWLLIAQEIRISLWAGGSKSSVTLSEWCHCGWVASQLCDHQPLLLFPGMTSSICPYPKLSGGEAPGSLLVPLGIQRLSTCSSEGKRQL